MNVSYRELFLKDLSKLRGTPAYEKIKELVFEVLPKADSLSEISNVKSLKNAEINTGSESVITESA